MAPTQITLTGDYGSDAVGFVDIERPMALTLDAVTYPPTHERVQLVDGAFSLAVDATDDTGVSPLNAYYRISEYINGQRSQKNIFVPEASPAATLDVNIAVPVNVTSILVFQPAEDSVGTPELQDDSVTTAKIVDEAVTTDKIQDEGVVLGKLSAAVQAVITAFSAGEIRSTDGDSYGEVVTGADDTTPEGSASIAAFDGLFNTSLSVSVANGSGFISLSGDAGSFINCEDDGVDRKVGFFGAAAVAQPTGVTVDAAGIHAALVSLGLITA